MLRFRYFTESLPAHEDPHHASQVPVMHGLGTLRLSWLRLDEDTIIGCGEVPNHVFTKLTTEDHDSIVLHTSLHEKKSVKDHLAIKNQGKHIAHFDALKKHIDINNNDTIVDVIAKLVDKGHTQFAPDK